jgi:hypothetical protein
MVDDLGPAQIDAFISDDGVVGQQPVQPQKQRETGGRR